MEYVVNKQYKIFNSNRISKEGITNLEPVYKVYKGVTQTGTGFQITTFPTNNCQFCSIGSANTILNSSDAFEILKDIYKLTDMAMFLIDLQRGHCDKLKKIFFDDNIVLETPYTSTNGSLMTLFLVKTEIFKS